VQGEHVAMHEGFTQGFLPGRHLIDAYGNGGFRFGEMSHQGSLLILPSGMRAWAARVPADLTEEAFAPVLSEAKNIELLLIGTGLDISPIALNLKNILKSHNISFDVMQSGAAARTYNILWAENRKVSAALLAV
jgi:uncharacterized protein